MACTLVATSSIWAATSDPCWLPSMRVNSTNTLTYLKHNCVCFIHIHISRNNYVIQNISQGVLIWLHKPIFYILQQRTISSHLSPMVTVTNRYSCIDAADSAALPDCVVAAFQTRSKWPSLYIYCFLDTK
jgi:hypothetical protein